VVRQQRARVVVLAVVQDSDLPKVLEVATALCATGHSPVFAVGGRSAGWEGAREAGIVVLPDRISEAASVAARLAVGTAAARWAARTGSSTPTQDGEHRT
jgi:hypothetical protein